ncbi:MAG: Hsp20/alpha crystallin family protein [Candidatus Berkelbacteria bacterium]|nr:Hsp20/alpha crystallin family protein [Candidatus Berkelbacteria bacterium]
MAQEEEGLEEFEGQLAIDVSQTDNEIVIQAPIAGVRPEELEVSISDEMVNIKGERKSKTEVKKENYLCQECYWGTFSRSYLLPIAVDSAKASASIKDGILTITIPKLETSKTKVLKIQTE